jgi:hypothetical protein
LTEAPPSPRLADQGGDRPGLLSRWLPGDPPAKEPVDRFARYGFFVAWLLGLVGIIGGLTPLIAPAGLLIATIGLMLFKNFRGLRDRMRKREERSWNYRLTESRSATKFGGVLMILVGIGWLAMGVADLLGVL